MAGKVIWLNRKREAKECDVCKQRGQTNLAYWDTPTQSGPWAYLCNGHMASMGIKTSVTTEFKYV